MSNGGEVIIMKKTSMIFTSMLVSSVLLSGCSPLHLAESVSQLDRLDTQENEQERTYEVATVRWGDWGDSYHEGFPDEAAKDTGIKIQWDTILHEDWGNRKAVLLAGSDLPDAFMGSICLDEYDILNDTDTFIALDDYIDQYMPNFKRIIETDPVMKALATSSDGHIYGLPSKKPCRPTVANQMFINQTWLDNLGLDMPTTYDEFVDVLRAFKEKDANGNGDPNDEIPYGEGFADSVLYFCLPFGTTPGGEGSYLMTVKDGEAVFIPATEQYKAGIAAMHECFKEGLIDQELFTQDDSMRDAKLMNETPIVGCAPGWTVDAVFGANADQYVAMSALTGPDGRKYISSDPQHWNYSRYEFVVTSFCKDPGKLLSWIDKFYTEDGTMQTFYGSFGVGVEKDEKADHYTVLSHKDISADLFAWEHSLRDFGPKYVPEGFEQKVTYEGDNGDAAKLELDKDIRQYATEAYPNVSYTAEQLKRIGAVYNDILNYVNSKRALWVTQGGVDEEWDEYIQTLEDMGYDDFLQIQKDAYATYQDAIASDQ